MTAGQIIFKVRMPKGIKVMEIAVALSGGVDSSVAAYLLKEKGFDVVGITLKLYEDESYIEDAKRVAERLSIPLYIFDYTEEFKKTVVNYFFGTYKEGKTPNPCVYCNRFAKFKFLIERAENLGIKNVATGHYAKRGNLNSHHVICKSHNADKDQSYFLSFLTEEQIKRLIFPLEDIGSKFYTRKIAKKLGLPTAKKKESYEVCFIKGDYRSTLLKEHPNYGIGYFTLDGKRIKKHEGIFNYTVGQRKGLKVPYSEALYVEKIDPETFDIMLSTKDRLYKKSVIVRKVNEIFVPNREFKATAKLRSMMNDEPCRVYVEKDRFTLEFEKEQFAPAPGQVACVYLNDCVILSGFIEESF